MLRKEHYLLWSLHNVQSQIFNGQLRCEALLPFKNSFSFLLLLQIKILISITLIQERIITLPI